MTPVEKHAVIQALAAQGQSIREISRNLKICRQAIRRCLRNEKPTERTSKLQDVDLELIRRLYKTCRGNVVRIHEILAEQHTTEIGYSTLTRLVREARLRDPKPRVGQMHFEPGEEMQHDTSPPTVVVGEKRLTAQCAGMQLAYSRYTFIKYYPCWTRFEARCFIADALEFFEGSAKTCMVDNSHVLVASGQGNDAVFAPEMEIMARMYGFQFRAHRVRDPKRKGGIERLFHTCEHNFLPGRTFDSWQDLNHQARQWCHRINNKEKRAMGSTPMAAYHLERPHLLRLPTHRPPIYQPLVRLVDSSGYITVDTNRYSVPDYLIGKRLEVHKTFDEIRVFFKDKLLTQHPRFMEKCRGQNTIPKHHRPLAARLERSGPAPQLEHLAGQHPLLDQYIELTKQRVRGRGIPHFRRLLDMWRTYPKDAFIAGLERACQYGLFDLNRLEHLILTHVAGDFFNLDLEGDI
jgi:transposase